MKLGAEFYSQDAVTLAQKLLGKLLVRRIEDKEIVAKIVETEAYVGPEDKACHAYDNKRTERTEIMFAQGGYSYVYLIYGIHHCFNVVAGDEGKPEAVLIRAVEPVTGLTVIKENRQIKSNRVEDLTNGPGKLCQALAIDRKLKGYNLSTGTELYIRDNQQEYELLTTPRINIDYAEEYKDKLWRFCIKGNSFLS
ncbi:DNA-3-methyladenine glycosylase [Natroniella acetigena]|uniref:DNA-3-methyladenine glycosylase n=1 Tax=Natroniella acetigena TaxID=52004 RepID=UPI00200B1ABA|nr:DNA-3-methyladenine glycosylase [Natroniella acetigena]MCK8826346.1 DNA-3-methyladenine glycosylase [Natroniella acetigena]